METRHILTLDMGGTNQRMAMISATENSVMKILKKIDIPKTETSIIPSINNFLKNCSASGWTTNTCVVGIAGPVDKNTNSCEKPTNVQFPIRGDEITKLTELSNVLVVNDFEAIGEEVSRLQLDRDNSNVKKVCVCNKIICSESCQNTRTNPLGNRAIIGPGTGLGVTYLFYNNDKFFTSPSEGGHSGIPNNHKLNKLYKFISNKLGTNQLGMEALVSGQGITHIIDFLLHDDTSYQELAKLYPEFLETVETIETDGEVTDDTLRNLINNSPNNISKLIGKNSNNNAKSNLAMRIFFDCLGSAVQSVALHGLATGGVFIAGGIVKNHLDLLQNGDFTQSFLENWKVNIKEILEKIPIYVITDYDISFYGCANIAIKEFYS